MADRTTTISYQPSAISNLHYSRFLQILHQPRLGRVRAWLERPAGEHFIDGDVTPAAADPQIIRRGRRRAIAAIALLRVEQPDEFLVKVLRLLTRGKLF